MNATYRPMLTIIDFLAVECLARVYSVPCTLKVNKRTALRVAFCVVYGIAVREWPDLAYKKVVDVGSSYILLMTDREGLATRQTGTGN